MKLEVGKRYVMRNGEVTGLLNRRDSYSFKDSRMTWRADGLWSSADVTGAYDIVAEYVEPQPQQPLRWVENCKPDKPGIWARKTNTANVNIWNYTQQEIDGGKLDYATRCYLGPIPEILPPVKKVVERLWLKRISEFASVIAKGYEERWTGQDDQPTDAGDWIRTDRTREREI